MRPQSCDCGIGLTTPSPPLHLATPTSSAAFNATTNRLTAASYDNAGNMTAHPFITPSGSIGYDANNLATQFTATGITASHGYDAQGRRVRVTHNGVTTIQVYDAMGRLAVEYSTQAPAQTNGVYYQTTDHLGSTRIVTDSGGQVKLRRDFFPFGEEIPASASYGNRHQVLDNGIATYNAWSGIPQQFTGQQRDNTGLDYFWARNYSGPSGRFLSVDPGNAGASIGNPQGWNAFSYVNGNPLSFVDPTGLDPCYHLVCVTVTEGGLPPHDPSSWFVHLIPPYYSGDYSPEELIGVQEIEPPGDFLSVFQGMLSVIGIVIDPVDALNCVIYVCRGEWGEAFWSAGAFPDPDILEASVPLGALARVLGRVGRFAASRARQVYQVGKLASTLGLPFTSRAVRALITKVPSDWVVKLAHNREGLRVHPDVARPGKDYIRIMKANLDGFPAQQVDYVKVRFNGKFLDQYGKPILVGNPGDTAAAHIPLEVWLSWSSWFRP